MFHFLPSQAPRPPLMTLEFGHSNAFISFQRQHDLGRTLRTGGREKKMQSSCSQKRFWDTLANTAQPKGLVYESAINVAWADEGCRVHENFWWSRTQECLSVIVCVVQSVICLVWVFLLLCVMLPRSLTQALIFLCCQNSPASNENSEALWQEC